MNQSENKGKAIALLPIGIFLVIFLGSGIVMDDFYAMPAIVAFLIYNKLNYSFFVETAALISFFVIFDALCCFIGFIVKLVDVSLIILFINSLFK